MFKKNLKILLFGIVLQGTLEISAQVTMPDNICEGQSRHYYVVNAPGSIYKWMIDGIVQTGCVGNEILHTWNTSGTFLIEVQERTADGCLGEVRSGQVIVHPLPVLEAQVINSVIYPGECDINFTCINIPDGIYDILYTSGSFNNIIVEGGFATVKTPPGIYNDLFIDVLGCTTKPISVILTDSQQPGLIIPNAISPNGDLINDVLNIGNSQLYPKMEVTIFNNWGQTVWKSRTGYPDPWDGRSNGMKLPIDSYFYIIDLHNGSKPIAGSVTLIK